MRRTPTPNFEPPPTCRQHGPDYRQPARCFKCRATRNWVEDLKTIAARRIAPELPEPEQVTIRCARDALRAAGYDRHGNPESGTTYERTNG